LPNALLRELEPCYRWHPRDRPAINSLRRWTRWPFGHADDADGHQYRHAGHRVRPQLL